MLEGRRRIATAYMSLWSALYSPVFPRTGPLTERSGYVHLSGLHTGLIRDAVTARRKINDTI